MQTFINRDVLYYSMNEVVNGPANVKNYGRNDYNSEKILAQTQELNVIISKMCDGDILYAMFLISNLQFLLMHSAGKLWDRIQISDELKRSNIYG